ncbi:NAD(P)H-binding protein [Sinomicrobium kalidii]|uniref:NAD(P)H-binding protein n=1 Tax=Sinomicrobium kalidii TaxID=2900738 RepID=UPI001E520186|nr:NAD(P)H-binding protein [Sinomicrobium kalidii]UGU16120.1 NAD(P)H-binding protein [Sinomicrobium kalidii]
MKHILIVGASGKVGKILAEKLKNAPDFIPTAFFRSPGQKVFFEEMGVAYHVGSIENSPEEIADALKGMDAVVFSAGSGGHTGDDKTLTVDLDGAVKVMEAAEKVKSILQPLTKKPECPVKMSPKSSSMY